MHASRRQVVHQAGARIISALVTSRQSALSASATYAALLAGQQRTVDEATKALVDKVTLPSAHLHNCSTIRAVVL